MNSNVFTPPDWKCVKGLALYAFMDLDGTLTDGTVILDGKKTLRRYSLQDGAAINNSKMHGVQPVVITSSPITADILQRFTWLDIPVLSVHGTQKSKHKLAEEFIGSSSALTAHIGDDHNDVSLLNSVNYPFMPSNHNPNMHMYLTPRVKVLDSAGGDGAVRDYLWDIVMNIIQ